MLRRDDRDAPRRARSGDTAARRSSRRRRRATARCRCGRARAPSRRRCSARATAARSRRARASCADGAAPATRRRRARPGMRSRERARQQRLQRCGRARARAPNSGCDSRPRAQRQRFARSPAGARPTRASTTWRPMSSSASVLHARRTRRLAAAAREAAVEMQLRLRRDRRAFEHLLDQVDAPARAVELVAQQLIGRTGRRAEAAMHARAQDRVGFAPLGRVADEIGERACVSSVRTRRTSRPRLRMPAGSNTAFSRRCSASIGVGSGWNTPARLVGRAKQRRVAAVRRGPRAQRRRHRCARSRSEPAQRAAPLDQLLAAADRRTARST